MNRQNNKARALELSTRMLSRDEFVEIVSQANALQTLAESRTQNANFDAIFERGAGTEITLERIPIQAVYDNATILGIEQKYISQALARYPSQEEIRADVKEIGAVPTFGIIGREYANTLLSRIREEFPLSQFELGDKWWGNGPPSFNTWDFDFSINSVTEEPAQKHFLWWSKEITIEKRDKWAVVIYNSRDEKFEIDLYNPLFLTACKETLKSLEKKFKKFIGPSEYTCHYPV